MQDENIYEIAHDDNKIEEIIRKRPQTCNSILKQCRKDKTLQFLLRKRLSRLVKQNRVWRLPIPGARGRKVIFCVPNSNYIIIVLKESFNLDVLFFFDFKENNEKIILEEYGKLSGEDWHYWCYIYYQKIIYKNKFRDGIF